MPPKRSGLFLIGALALLASLAMSVHAAPDGAKLFDSNCSACHGSDGSGALGVPLIKQKFATLTDDYLIKTIRYGRPGRVMPAFETLSDAQVEAIVLHLRKWSETRSFEEQPYQQAGDTERGLALFEEKCVACHGEAGRGVGKGTGVTFSRKREFEVIPPSIGNPGFLRSASDAMLRRTIGEGRKGTAMPSFEALGLEEQGFADLVAYLRGLEDAPRLTAAEEEEVEVPPTPTIVVESSDDFDTTVKNIKEALNGANFRIFPDRYLEAGLFFDSEVNKKQLTIRFCNFNELYGMLKMEPRLGIALPCRITVVEDEDGQVKLIAMNMALIADMFNNDQLYSYALQMQQTIGEILEEATF